ncbi:hypothetical protein [Desulfovibrio sp. ZJ200]|uniref:hypothetical protein n=1 Tax=Desulfovibrio sp. ZJ200 TaxID=2709792 RepID=UPI0013EA2018|nr:hypothetical protein [Desulfovibrio sp. ZJ200]
MCQAFSRCGAGPRPWLAVPCPEHFLFENALLTRKRQPPQRGVHSGENRVFRLNATFDFHKKSKVICSRVSPHSSTCCKAAFFRPAALQGQH